FIRPIEETDGEAIRAFLARNSTRSAVPVCGLVGKLVGDLVAVLAMEITSDGVRIDDLVVAKELRRKRIARVMLMELDSLAAKMEREWLIVERDDARDFLMRVGFSGERRMVRRVGR